MFAAENGAYTLASPGATTCLGKESDYLATDRFPAGVCAVDSSNSANNWTFSCCGGDTVVNEMQINISDMPNVPTGYEVRYGSTSWYYRGAWAHLWDNGYQIEVALPGNVSCPSNMQEYDGSGGIHWCEIAVW